MVFLFFFGPWNLKSSKNSWLFQRYAYQLLWLDYVTKWNSWFNHHNDSIKLYWIHKVLKLQTRSMWRNKPKGTTHHSGKTSITTWFLYLATVSHLPLSCEWRMEWVVVTCHILASDYTCNLMLLTYRQSRGETPSSHQHLTGILLSPNWGAVILINSTKMNV